MNKQQDIVNFYFKGRQSDEDQESISDYAYSLSGNLFCDEPGGLRGRPYWGFVLTG